MAVQRVGTTKKDYGKDMMIMIKEYPLPESIDSYILKGIKKGKRVKGAKAVSKFTGIAATVLIAVFIFAVRVSPVFASYASSVPGLEYIVKLITDDKGLQSAVDNAFIQKVDKSEEAENLIFTVKDIIADNTNLIVFYSIENKGGYKWPIIQAPKILDANGKDLGLSVLYGSSPTEDKVIEEKIVFNIPKEMLISGFVLSDNIIISTRVAVHEKDASEKPKQLIKSVFETGDSDIKILNHEFRIPVTINRAIFANIEKDYILNRTIDVGGQKITFDSIRICPTRLEMKISLAPENTMKIFYFEDLKVIDEEGREWGSIINGISGTQDDDNHRTLYFQSNYFTSPSKLHITGNSMRALDKADLRVIVDLKNKKFIKAPDDKLTLTDIKYEDNKIAFFYKLETKNSNHSYNVFTTNAFDSNMVELNSVSSGDSTADEHGIQEGNMVFEYTSPLSGPITFTLTDYPNSISSPFRIDVIK
ncbi:MAG: DUF4179 domain-containing protein [Ruminiclostridium sp.]|nr:DUF4179 domain-containing protein [Ruminiclostridium sp.]